MEPSWHGEPVEGDRRTSGANTNGRRPHAPHPRLRHVAATLAALTVGVIAATAGTGGSGGMTMSHAGHRMTTTGAKQVTAADLRVTLHRLLGEHAVLAMNATNIGVTGSKAFPAAAKALDRNSVEIS
jgi:hypothetical protein